MTDDHMLPGKKRLFACAYDISTVHRYHTFGSVLQEILDYVLYRGRGMNWLIQ